MIDDGEGEAEAEAVGTTTETGAEADVAEKAQGEISPSLTKRGRSADLHEGGEEVVGKKVKIDGKLPALLQR